MKYALKNAGLFIHWGINTGNTSPDREIQYKSFEDFENEAMQSGWSASKWIDAAKKLRASYITLASFHCFLGYMKLWKSEIPGTYISKHDFLGDLIREGKKENIKIIVYLTPDPKLYKFPDGKTVINSRAYCEYKNDYSLDLMNSDTWQRIYCKEIIEELIDNYPDLGGFWFDGWSCRRNTEEIFEMIEKKNPKLLKIRNNFGTFKFKNEDINAIEDFGKIYEPEFDLASSCYQKADNNEYCYIMRKETGDWWYHIKDLEEIRNTNVIKKFVTAAAYGVRPHVGLGPYVSGDFSENIMKYLDMMDGYLKWAAESVFDITPGMLPQCHINDGGYIVTTMRDNIHYIHILKAPSGECTEICDGGYIFENACVLKTGDNINFRQINGKIYFEGDFSSCEADGDFVIKLTAKGRRIIKTVKPEDENVLPCSINIELEKESRVSGMFLEQRDNSAQLNGSWGSVDNNRLKDYRIAGADESGNEFVVDEDTLDGTRGNKQINFDCRIKSLRFEALNSYDTHDEEAYVWNGTQFIKADISEMPDEPQIVLDKDSNKYYIDNGKLYCNGRIFDTEVTDVCSYKGVIQYCKNKKLFEINDGNTSIYETDYKITGVTEKTFLLDDGTLLLRNDIGHEDCVYNTGVSKAIVKDDVIYVIKGKRSGKLNLLNISLIGK